MYICFKFYNSVGDETNVDTYSYLCSFVKTNVRTINGRH